MSDSGISPDPGAPIVASSPVDTDRELVQSLVTEPDSPDLEVREGMVTGIGTTNGWPTVAVTVGRSDGVNPVNLRYLGSYSPRIGDKVAVVQVGNDPWVMGALAPYGAGLPVGSIVDYGGSTAPVGWLLCNGQSTSGYPALAAVVGSTVPDLRGRFVLGSGSGSGLTSRSLGQRGGAETHALAAAEVPSHTHSIPVTNNPGTTDEQGWPPGNNHQTIRSSDRAGSSTRPATGSGIGLTGNAHNNMPPFHVLTKIIKAA